MKLSKSKERLAEFLKIMTFIPADAAERLLATDPEQSFIVQAPAGSGKTEILTQRYLRLLARVSAPEQVVALTFTRKAANEMRERILSALEKASKDKKPASLHEAQTLRYAAEALKKSEHQDWHLLEHPGRLRITTIDALCQSISYAIPGEDKQLACANITERPEQHYFSAAKACLEYFLKEEKYHAPLKHLLFHLDNRQDELLNFFSRLLASRSQWLSDLYLARNQKKEYYEKMLLLLEEHALRQLKQSLAKSLQTELLGLCQALCLVQADRTFSALETAVDFQKLNKKQAQTLALLLLNTQNNLRKGFDHHVGLRKGLCEESQYQALKAQSKTLLASLAQEKDFVAALLRIKHLPEPFYDIQQWETLQALFELLPLLVAHLHLVFSEANEIDFIAIGQQALLALGDEEQPTDLALYLDHRISHLLIDEFQDTSIQQFQLLSQLVQGWQGGDQRTLLLVGDPMQSIYRFRQAEVGLFLKAKQEGIGGVPLKFIELFTNFRASKTLVEWTNQHFKAIFPKQDDMESGGISFSSSKAMEEKENSYIKAWCCQDVQEEAQQVIETVAELLQQYPNDKLAILVKTRSQLKYIIAKLQEQAIPFQGIDIDRLAEKPHIQDLWLLTQALFLPANRLVWLSLLRSPLCGLPLQDLHRLAQLPAEKSLFEHILTLSPEEGFSEEGFIRARFFGQVLEKALATRHQQRITSWVIHTYKALYGEQILNSYQQNDIEQYWDLLSEFSKEKESLDLCAFEKQLNQLYSRHLASSSLYIMTIHKAKGLEFDSILLPGLSAAPYYQDKPLLRWLKVPSAKQQELFLVSPIKSAQNEKCLLYTYLEKLDREKSEYELQRLLYVALTRAKKRIFLFDRKEKETKNTFRSLLSRQAFEVPEHAVSPKNEEVAKLPLLQRLALAFYQKPLPALSFPPQESILLLSVSQNEAEEKANILSELLAWSCRYHPLSSEELPWKLACYALKKCGFSEKTQARLYQELQVQMQAFFQNAVAQWIIGGQEKEYTAYKVYIQSKKKLQVQIIDRVFIAEGKLWMINFKYKMILEDKDQLEMNKLAKNLKRVFPLPIACGLYYVNSLQWVHWMYQKDKEKNYSLDLY